MHRLLNSHSYFPPTRRFFNRRLLLQPIADVGLNIAVVMSDKRTGLYPAIPSVFPDATQALCQSHYFKNMAEPVAETDQRMKVALRQAVRAAAGALIRDEAVESTAVLTVTGMIPTPDAGLPPTHCRLLKHSVYRPRRFS